MRERPYNPNSFQMPNLTPYLLGALVLLVIFGCGFAFRSLGMIHYFVSVWYRLPVLTNMLLVGTSLFGVLWMLSSVKGSSASGCLSAIITTVLGLGFLFMVFSGDNWMKIALYQETDYERVQQLIPVTEARPVSYSEARHNFLTQNAEAVYEPGDLDYVQAQWRAELAPSGWNKWYAPAEGYYAYSPNGQQSRVVIRREQMSCTSSGSWTNHCDFLIHNNRYWAETYEYLLVEDIANNELLMVTSLVYRRGFWRTPYVGEVAIIHSDGEIEFLSPRAAEADTRLDGIQLNPEWLVRKQVEAYGLRNGFWDGAIFNKGNIQVQTSEINAENSAPYHMEAEPGMTWYVPFGPKNKPSLQGVMMTSSEDVGGSVQIWELPQDQNLKGADALATTIKSAPQMPAGINWVRRSSVEGGNVATGDTDVIELLPIVKDGELWFYGFIAIDPPVRTRFYVLINPRTEQVLRPVNTIEEVEAWLRGELTIASTPLQTQSGGNSNSTAPSADLQGLTDQQLRDLQRAIIDEMERRASQQ